MKIGIFNALSGYPKMYWDDLKLIKRCTQKFSAGDNTVKTNSQKLTSSSEHPWQEPAFCLYTVLCNGITLHAPHTTVMQQLLSKCQHGRGTEVTFSARFIKAHIIMLWQLSNQCVYIWIYKRLKSLASHLQRQSKSKKHVTSPKAARTELDSSPLLTFCSSNTART